MEQTRSERLSINLYDLDRASSTLIVKCLGGKIGKDVVTVDSKKEDEIAVIFTCPLEIAALATDILQSEYRREKLDPIRVYIQRKGGWSKLRAQAVLTIMHAGQRILNPEYFPIVVSSMTAEPLAPVRFDS